MRIACSELAIVSFRSNNVLPTSLLYRGEVHSRSGVLDHRRTTGNLAPELQVSKTIITKIFMYKDLHT